jgi:transposase
MARRVIQTYQKKKRKKHKKIHSKNRSRLKTSKGYKKPPNRGGKKR